MAQDGLTEDRAEWQGRTLGDQLDDRGGPEWVRRGGMGCQGGPIRSTEGALCAQASLSCRPPPSKAAGSWGGAPRFHRGQREPLGSSPSRGGTLDLALTPGADGKWRPWKESSGKKATQRDPAPPPHLPCCFCSRASRVEAERTPPPCLPGRRKRRPLAAQGGSVGQPGGLPWKLPPDTARPGLPSWAA